MFIKEEYTNRERYACHVQVQYIPPVTPFQVEFLIYLILFWVPLSSIRLRLMDDFYYKLPVTLRL